MLTSSCRLQDTEWSNELHEGVDSIRLRRELDNAVVSANIENLALELVGHEGDSAQMLVLVTERLADSEVAWVEVFPQRVSGCFLGKSMAFLFCQLLGIEVLQLWATSHVAVVSEELLEVLGAEDRDLGEEQLALNKRGLCVVEHGPDRNQVLELAAGLLDNTLLALQDDGHARQVIDLGVADYETVDVEATSSQDAGNTREHTGLVLHQAVEDVLLVRLLRGHGRLVEDAADSGGGGPGGRAVFGRERGDAAVQGLVGQGLGGGRVRARRPCLLAHSSGALPGEQAAQRQHGPL